MDFPDDTLSTPTIQEGHLLSGGKEDERDRGYTYAITDHPNDFSQRLTLNELKTFFENISQEKPFWSHTLPASTDHSIILLEREAGFRILFF
ncbi:hypothetical protein [Rickettsia conorii]|uniref:hypothetical protein n=1 Tax=Rickettsia conorii TaxID=781 RepID=UPI00226092DA|nr:hypothetical protein [Rickettsia conorii]UZW38338.1 hypothetical protein OSR38_05055 [Rickettsia conorii subsp. heilongjiangensis]